MADLSHREADLLAAEVEAGRATDHQRMRLELHLQRCDECARRHERIAALGRALREGEQPASSSSSDSALALRAVLEARGEGTGAERPRVPSWALAAAAVLLLAAAGIGVARMVASSDGPPRAAVRSPEATGGRAPAERAGRAKPEPKSPAEVERASLATGELLAPCEGVRVRAAPGTRARRQTAAAGACSFRLDQGELRLHVDPNAELRVRVDTPTATIEVTGTVFVVRVDGDGTEVSVARGNVVVGSSAGKVRIQDGQRAHVDRTKESVPEVHPMDDAAARELTAGFGLEPQGREPARAAGAEQARDRRSLGELRRMVRSGRSGEARSEARRRSRKARSARRQAELLTIVAESYSVEGEDREAVRVYRRIADGPPSTTAANALVAGAAILLDRLGEPGRALHLYDRYLNEHPQGSLREVVAFERCRALRANGRAGEATRCARQYLDDFPRSRFRERARALLDR